MGKRSIVYIDAFNLYYGAIKGTAHKWLDLEKYFTRLRQDDEVMKIRYFTARVSGPSRSRQDAYLRALSTLPLVEITEGKYKRRERRCGVVQCTHAGSRAFHQSEEKRTDVNIAIHMLDDAYQDSCDRMILVTGDSDLVPAVSRVRHRFPKKKVIVYVPSREPVRGQATELRFAATHHKTLPNELLRRCHFPSTINAPDGSVITKPPHW